MTQGVLLPNPYEILPFQKMGLCAFGSTMGAPISAVRAIFCITSSPPTPLRSISTIYPNSKLHLHFLEMPHYIRQCLRVTNAMPQCPKMSVPIDNLGTK